MVKLVLFIGFILGGCHRRTPPHAQKKPAWRNTQRYSTTPAYSSTGLPASPSCPLSSHPTFSTQVFLGVKLSFTKRSISDYTIRFGEYKRTIVKANGLLFRP